MRLCILVTAVCVLTAFGSARPELGFDPQAVVRQVRAAHSSSAATGDEMPAFDAGEFLVDTSSSLAPTPGSQTDVAVGFDGENFLVVWQDLRGGNYWDISGARVTPEGVLLDPSGFAVSRAAYDQQHPAIAFDGTNFLVVWEDFRRGHAYDIYGTRLTTAGQVLDPAGIIISQANNDQEDPDVAFDGSNFLVVWQDTRDGGGANDIYAARVTPGSIVLDTAGFVVSQAVLDQYTPAVAFDGTNYLVVWQDCRYGAEQADVFGARVTTTGFVLDTSGLNISQAPGAQSSPALAFDSTNFMVTWQDVVGEFPPVVSIFAGRVTPSGVVLDPGGFAVARDSRGICPGIAFDGANFLVVWYEVHGLALASFHILGKRVTPSGSVLDTIAISISEAADTAKQAPAIGFGGGGSLVAWQDDRNAQGEPDVYAARVTPGGEVLDTSGFLLSQSARGQYAPAIGFDGANFLVAWEDDRAGYTDIYGARVTPSGAVLDSCGIAVSQAQSWQHNPSVASNGANSLIVWQDYRTDPDAPDIYGARVAPDGTVLDPGGIVISDASDRQYSPAVAFGGGVYLVVWQDFRNGSYDVYSTRVASDGTVLSSDGIIVSEAANWQCNPVLGFDGTNFFAVWEDYRNTPGYPDIYGARVSPGGNVLDPYGIAISKANQGQYSPVLAFDGNNYLVVWDDTRTSDWPDIYGARVSTSGIVRDTAGIAISRASKDQFAPAIAFDGAAYLVVYEDYRGSNNPDIYGARVSPAGLVSDEGAVQRPAGNQTSLALARGPGSLLFLSYQGWAGSVGGKTYNTDRIWGLMNPVPGGGVEDVPHAILRASGPPTIVRGVLFLSAPAGQHDQDAILIDISGRKVLGLKSGANDVRVLAPGVYFVRYAAGSGGSTANAQKVVVAK